MLCLFLSACKDNAEIDYGNSIKFSKKEIKSAVEIVLGNFKYPILTGIDLKKIWYDENESDSVIKSNENSDLYKGIKQENIIVLLTEFDVCSDDRAYDYGFSPGQHCKWHYILTRESEDDNWTVKDYGV